LGIALLCPFHGAIVKNTLFENGDGTNTFRVLNPTQAFLHFNFFLLLTHCGARANIIIIILLRNGYF